jgi:adenine-specific DNA-methyltransferase
METTGSPSLLDLDSFATPFDYELVVTQGGESRTVRVDLPETFNYLLGLRVQNVRCHGAFRTVEGIDPEGQRVLVVWRSLADPAANDEALARLYREQGYAARPPETALDRVYVNGDTTLADSLTGTTVPEVFLTEEAFHRLMFAATAGVA